MLYTHTRKWKQHQDDDPTCNIDNLIAWTLNTPIGNVIKQDLQRIEDAGGELVHCTLSDNGRASMSFKFSLSIESQTITTKAKLSYVEDEESSVKTTVSHVYDCAGESIVDVIESVHETIAPNAKPQTRLTDTIDE